MQTMSLSPRSIACATWHCQRHGRRWNFSIHFCLISAVLGTSRGEAGWLSDMVNAYVNCCYRMTSYRQPTVYLFVSERSSVYLTGEARRRPPLFAYVWCQPSVRVEGLKLARDAGASRIPHCCLALRLDLDLHRAEISPQLEQTGGKEPGCEPSIQMRPSHVTR